MSYIFFFILYESVAKMISFIMIFQNPKKSKMNIL